MERQPLSEQQKQSLEKLLKYLYVYFSTPEGRELGKRLEKIVQRIQARKPEIVLSRREQEAFSFIKSCKDTPPSIREVTRHLGLKSSHSGFKIVQTLLEKKVVSKAEDGRLAFIEV
jgi:hypothetical protein